MHRRALITLTPEEQRQFLETSKTIILCTIDRHGYPHAVPMWYVTDGDAVLMTTYRKSQKVMNIRRNPKVALLIESGTTYETLKGLMIRGEAEIIDDLETCVSILSRIHQKMSGSLSPNLEEAMRAQARKRVALRIAPRRVSSWDHAKLGGVY